MPLKFSILAINPGSTSTKLALFYNRKEIKALEISHRAEDLNSFSSIAGQEDYRFSLVKELLEDMNSSLDAVIGRGGLLKPLSGGVYRVNDTMIDDLRNARYGEHASNLGAILASRVAREQKNRTGHCEAFIADPVVVDELLPQARLSGIPEIERRSIFHALNQKSVGRNLAERLGKSYEEMNLIVCHMGGGVTVGAHRKGRVIDVNNGLDGDGPFSPERSGGVPAWQLAELVLSGRFSREEVKKKITGKGGVFAYCGSKDMVAFENLVLQGDAKTAAVYEALVFQLSQEIAKHGATLEGEVDAIILTGGLARFGKLVRDLDRKISFLAPVYVIPGEREMEALAENALAALTGNRLIQEYGP